MENTAPASFPVRRFRPTTMYPGYQFYAALSLEGEGADAAFRFAVLTVQKWIDERVQAETEADPFSFREAEGDPFRSYLLDENAFVLNVTYSAETGEWAARLRETDSFVSDGKPGEGRVFITRIAVRKQNETDVALGVKIDVIESEQMAPFGYAYRPKFIRWLFSPDEITGKEGSAAAAGVKTVLRQAGRALTLAPEPLQSKGDVTELTTLWKSADNTLPWVIFTEPGKPEKTVSLPPELADPRRLPADWTRVETPVTTETAVDVKALADRFASSGFGFARTFFVPLKLAEHLKATLQTKPFTPGSVLVIDPACFADSRRPADTATYYDPNDVRKRTFGDRLKESVRRRGVRKTVPDGGLRFEKELAAGAAELRLARSAASAAHDSRESLARLNAEYEAAVAERNTTILNLQEENRRLGYENARLNNDASYLVKDELEKKDMELLARDERLARDADVMAGMQKEIDRLRAENAGLHDKLDRTDALPILFMGQEKEFFPGEIRDIVLSILNAELADLQSTDCRRTDVLRDLLAANPYDRLLGRIADELKVRMTGYTTMTPPLQGWLEEQGLKIVSSKNHYKLVYHDDPRYTTTLSKTASDRGHGDLNAANDIVRKML